MKVGFVRIDERRELKISESSERKLFDRIAQAIQQCCGGVWSARLDGLDQRYWDLEAGEAKITLHLEHYLGINAYAAPDAASPEASARLLDRIGEVLSVANLDP